MNRRNFLKLVGLTPVVPVLAQRASQSEIDSQAIMDSANLPEPLPEFLVVGIDLGRQRDHTACVVMNHSGKIVDIDYFNNLTISEQLERIRLFREKHGNPLTFVADQYPPYQELDKQPGTVVGLFIYNTEIRNDFLTPCMRAFDCGNIKISSEVPWFSELMFQVSSMEAVTNHRERLIQWQTKHRDDLVVATALAWKGVRG